MEAVEQPPENPQSTMSDRAYKTFESRGLYGQESKVELIKTHAAQLWDAFDNISVPPDNSEAGRLVATAKTQLESAVMFAVKAVSRYQ